jgi:hypothetical protein
VTLPAVLTAAQQRLHASPFALGHQHGWKYEHLDAQVLAAIGDALAAADPAARRALDDRLARAAWPARDLLCPYHLHEPLARPYWTYAQAGADRQTPGTLRAYWPVSEFSFINAGEPPAGFGLVGRLPDAVSGRQRKSVRVTLNGHDAGAVLLGEHWTKGEVRIAAGNWQRGVNTVRIYWPPPPTERGEVWAPVIGRLEQGLSADLHPCLGELCGLTIVRP